MARDTSNDALPPTVNIPPPAGQPNNQIGWRPLLVNWFGSMFFIGLCSPLIVWFAVYYIRTRGRNVKKGAAAKNDKTDKSEKSIKKGSSPSISTVKAQIKSEIRPLDGWIAPIVETKPLNPRTRMSKRDHFCRYLGWWSTSAAEPRKSDEPRAEKDKAERGRAEKDRAREIPVPLSPEPHPWRGGTHPVAHISLENLAERGQLLRALSSIPEVITPKTEVPPTSTGVEVKQVDGPPGSNVPHAEEFYLMSGGLGSDELGSDNNTVRKRTIGKIQAIRWAELSHQLSKSAHHRLLIFDGSQQATPDSETGEQQDGKPRQQVGDTEFRGHEDETTLAATPDLKSSNEQPPISSSHTRPKLRKVFSSPTLNEAFSQDALGAETSKASGLLETPSPDFPHQSSAPVILYPYRDNLDITSCIVALKDHTNLPGAAPVPNKGLSSISKTPSPLGMVESANDGNSCGSSKTYLVPAPPSGDLLPPKCRKRKTSPSSQQEPGPQRQQRRNLHSWSWDRTRRSTIDVPDGSDDESHDGNTGHSPTLATGAEAELADGMEEHIAREYGDGLDTYERCDSLLDGAADAASSCSSAHDDDNEGNKGEYQVTEVDGVLESTGEVAERAGSGDEVLSRAKS